MREPRAFAVSFGILTVSTVPYVLIFCIFVLGDLRLGILPIFAVFVFAVFLAWKRGEDIYEWWLRGYVDYEVSAQKFIKSTKPRKDVASATHLDSMVEKSSTWVESDNATVESQNVTKEARVTTLEKPSHTVEIPSKEDLARLKEALKMRTGSLVYKKSGNKIYKVTYDRATKKKKWTQLGLWSELSKLIRNQ